MIRLYPASFGWLLRSWDLAVATGGFWLVARLHGMPWNPSYTLAATLAGAIYLGVAEARGLYRAPGLGWALSGSRDAILVWGLMLLGLVTVAYVTKTSDEFSRRVLLTWAGAGSLLLVCARIGIASVARARRRRSRGRRAVIVGAGELGRRVAEALGNPWLGIDVVGFYDDRHRVDRHWPGTGPADVLGSLADLETAARAGEIEVVFLALPMRAESRMRALVRSLADTSVSVFLVPDLLAFTLLRAKWLSLGSVSAVSLFERPLLGGERMLKRVEDVVIACAGLVVLSVPMLLIAAAIKLTSPGPAIFRQRRHGLDGREIVVWKFRSMRVCESDSAFHQARRGDLRVTRLGAFLRATSLDELPQLVNVVQGRMSIVGPRPHPLLLNEQHRDLIDWYMLRHRVKPGITGWAQVNGCRGETETPDKMQRRIEYDLEYIERWSIWFDARIIAMTFLRGMADPNAY